MGGTVHVGPTEAAIRDGVVLIRDGTIAAVGRRKVRYTLRAGRVVYRSRE